MVTSVPEFIPALRPFPEIGTHRYIHVVRSSVFISDRLEIDAAPVHFIGMHGDEAVWAVDVPHGEDPSYGAATDLYSYYGRASEVEWAIAGRAVQLTEWARTHRFCGRCATATELSETDRSMKCPACGLLAYPRLAPAMITLVTRGEPGPDQEALLARGVAFRAPLYSCLAGFVEPGESLEQSVIREVREEVGIEITNPRYWGSQPWPFPHSLMLGFTAEWVSGEIECDPSEIVDANWYRKDELPTIPPRISIARKLIDAWLAE
jgi:NAD+ diphosphatase